MEYSWLTHILKEQVKRVKFKEFEKERKINVYKFQLYTMQATFRTVQIPVLIFKVIKCWNITDLIMKNSKTLDSYDNIIQLIRYNSFPPPPTLSGTLGNKIQPHFLSVGKDCYYKNICSILIIKCFHIPNLEFYIFH